MTDVAAKRPLRVEHSDVGPYLKVTVEHLPTVRQVLDRHQIFHWVDRNPLRLDGVPWVTWINFGRRGDAGHIQAVLDSEG